MSQLIQDNHRFLDEAGDTTFYGKGKVPINGKDGVSSCFIASRGKTTKNNHLQMALEKAQSRNKGREVTTEVLFNVQNHRAEPLLNVADYFCWSIQRVFEWGELRYYNFLKDKISLVVDLYDTSRYQNSDNYYSPKKPLTPANKV